MKVLAINLPAYHEIPENNEWWGKGFTEWDNVKSGKPLYKDHYQPIRPYNNFYYDLSKKEDIEKQINLANKYNIYGFVYYHYWFGNKRMLFQRPAEIVRDEIKNSNFHYCFCWANATWYTTWHGLDPKTLLKQEYPGKSDWEEHYNYLRSFFLDSKYIKFHNKPMLFIYNPSEIPNYNQLVNYLNERARQDGFDGVYLVEYITSKNRDLYSEYSDAVYEFEPLYTTFFDVSKWNLLKRFICKKLKMPDYQSYDTLWKFINKRNRTYNGKTIFKGCFSGWDNSARKGKESMIVKGRTPEKFRKNFQKFITRKRVDASEEFCVINAWNEWSEGAYLEPDDKDGYAYLQAIRDVIEESNKDN